jgi:hypothetical protein
MVFFEGLKQSQTPKLKFTEVDATNAKQLYETLASKRCIMRKASIKQWANEFRLLAEYVDQQRIHEVLDWYTANCRAQYVPEAFSAKSFRSKFPNIEAAMERSQPAKRHPITHQGKKLSDWLKQVRDWPGETEEDVDQCVEQSLHDYQEFLFKLTSTSWKDGLSGGGLNRHLHAMLPAPEEFVKQWMLEINQFIHSGKFKSTITKLGFRPDHPKFQKTGRTLTTNYCGDGSQWDKLIKLMN